MFIAGDIGKSEMSSFVKNKIGERKARGIREGSRVPF